VIRVTQFTNIVNSRGLMEKRFWRKFYVKNKEKIKFWKGVEKMDFYRYETKTKEV